MLFSKIVKGDYVVLSNKGSKGFVAKVVSINNTPSMTKSISLVVKYPAEARGTQLELGTFKADCCVRLGQAEIFEALFD